jgi:hypothetical protein
MTLIDCPCCCGAGKVEDPCGLPLTSVEREIFKAGLRVKATNLGPGAVYRVVSI